MVDKIYTLNGLYVGMLDDDELAIFNQAVNEGKAIRDYNHPAGFFCGLAKVKIIEK